MLRYRIRRTTKMIVKDQVSLPVLFEDDEISAYKLFDHLWLFEAKKGVKSSIYILEGKEKTLIIDSGNIVTDLPSRVSKISAKPQTLALTHAHPDHAGSVDQFDTIYMNKNDENMIPNYKGKIIEIDENFTFDIGGIHLQVINLSGHTPGSIGFLDLEDRWLFTGDAIGSTCVWMQVTPYPLESLMGAIRSIEKVSDKFDKIIVGHYRQMDGTADITYVQKMKALLEKILYTSDFPVKPFTKGPGQELFSFKIDPVVASLDGVGIVFNRNRIHYV